MKTNWKKDIKDSINYLTEGGLGEMMAALHNFMLYERKQVVCDTDMVQALLLLADEALKARAAAARVRAH